MGLYVKEEYGGQGLSQTGYARVFEAIGQVDGSLTIGMGVHQSIGLKGIALFGSDEQKERFLPDLASGRKLAGFALTEPNAGSDAYHLESRAVKQPDGSWVLNGEKRWIGNAGRGDVLTAFARAEVDGKDSHIALILEKGMKGLEAGDPYDTMGLRGIPANIYDHQVDAVGLRAKLYICGVDKPLPPISDMSPAEFRKHGHVVIDWIADYLAKPDQWPVLPGVRPGDVRESRPQSPPARGERMDAILEDFERLIVPATTHWNHPAFLAYFANSSTATPCLEQRRSKSFVSASARGPPSASDLRPSGVSKA